MKKSRKENAIVFLDIKIGREDVGRLTIEVFFQSAGLIGNKKDKNISCELLLQLRADVAPKAAENFRLLCLGWSGYFFVVERVY